MNNIISQLVDAFISWKYNEVTASNLLRAAFSKAKETEIDDIKKRIDHIVDWDKIVENQGMQKYYLAYLDILMSLKRDKDIPYFMRFSGWDASLFPVSVLILCRKHDWNELWVAMVLKERVAGHVNANDMLLYEYDEDILVAWSENIEHFGRPAQNTNKFKKNQCNQNNVQQIVNERNIKYLLHFTRLGNLEGILQYGIYPRCRLDDLPCESTINDESRWDSHSDSVSLSVSFPNYFMFYKYRNETNDNWVVIVLHPRVLWEYDCAFCKHNAADSRISCLPIESITDHNALNEMFDKIDGHRSREDQKLKPCDPTDPQAEILVFDIVDPENILGVVFRDKASQVKYKKKYPTLKTWYHMEGKGVTCLPRPSEQATRVDMGSE